MTLMKRIILDILNAEKFSRYIFQFYQLKNSSHKKSPDTSGLSFYVFYCLSFRSEDQDPVHVIHVPIH